MYDAILVLAGGLKQDGTPHEWTRRRLDKALEIYEGEYLITLSAGTVHKPPVLREGFPIFESKAMADYILEQGIDPNKIFTETASYDTIGNAYFARVIHTDPRNMTDLAVVTSEFHMPRSRVIFDWVFGLTPTLDYALTYFEASDEGIDEEIIRARTEKERTALKRLYKTREGVETLAQFHDWMYSEHTAYATGLESEKAEGDALKTY